MSDEQQTPEEEVSDEALAEQEKAMRALVGSSLRPPPPAAASSPNLLPGIQRKIRRRSKGKFFADGWSTSQTRVNYALVAMIMLIVIGVAYVALAPMGFSR